MKDEVAGRPTFSEKFKELMQKIENRNTTKQMSDKELRDLRRAIDEELIRRKAIECVQILANQLK